MKIFISHATADKEIAERYTQLLKKYAKMEDSDIFCSSIDGLGVETGKEWDKDIVSNFKKSDIVIYLLTKNFLARPNCIIELGWSLLCPKITFCYLEEEENFDAADYPSFLSHRQRLSFEQEKAKHLLNILKKKGADVKEWERDLLKTTSFTATKSISIKEHRCTYAKGATAKAPLFKVQKFFLQGWAVIS